MTNPKPNRSLSLGKLRPHTKTKDKSPHAVGTISIKRDLLLHLHRQINQCDDDDIVAELAGWFNEDAIGKYMTVQQPRDDKPFWDFR